MDYKVSRFGDSICPNCTITPTIRDLYILDIRGVGWIKKLKGGGGGGGTPSVPI